jgi:hypothetical protein
MRANRGLSPVERFWTHVDERGLTECWLWTSWCCEDGVPRFRVERDKHQIQAKRFLWERILNYTIPAGYVMTSTCGNSKCVNPNHLACVPKKSGRTLPRQSKRKYQAEFRAWKASLSCAKCGYKGDPRRIHFHHKDKSTYEFKISNLCGKMPLDTLLKHPELQKCEPLCWHCHLGLHVTERKQAA